LARSRFLRIFAAVFFTTQKKDFHFIQNLQEKIMRFTLEQDDDIVIFTLKEARLDGITAPDVKAEILIVSQPDIKALILDLSNVEFVDSHGLSALLLASRQMKEHSAPVAIVGANEHTQRLLRISQLDLLFDFYPTLAEALEDYHGDDEEEMYE
jgi:anti-sigma B factor antagonist